MVNLQVDAQTIMNMLCNENQPDEHVTWNIRKNKWHIELLTWPLNSNIAVVGTMYIVWMLKVFF